METLEQYQQRVSTQEIDFTICEVDAWCNLLKENKVFTVVPQELATEIEASSRVRGAVDMFLTNLTEFYTQWRENNEDSNFVIALNANPGDPFAGKKTDSLYSSIGQRINKLDLKQTWRLIRKDDHLYIAHL